MNIKNIIFLCIVLLNSFLLNCQSKNSDNEEKQRVIAGVLINNVTGGTSSSSSSSSTVVCSNSAPTFSTLATAGVTSNCARSGCHVGSSPQSGLDMTSYNSVISKVTPRNGSGSLLYQKVNGGSMQQYTTSQITTAIFCWIQGGALP
jgi:hypothetical protein